MKKLLNKSGLILAEALIAIGMLTTAVLILGNIFDSAIQTTMTSKHYLIAQNLATEGVASVINIRDTNRLLNPNRPNCWMAIDPDGQTKCDDNVNPQAQPAINTPYVPIEKAYNDITNGKWYLQEKNIAVTDNYRIYYDTVLKKFTTALKDPTEYYRYINFTRSDKDRVDFDVIVEWGYGGNGMNKVTRKATLYNYKNE